ncbi:unnamed protein product [Rangifer tarandus platyrhynchus]|uniref:Uncharacterized protein n=3 Tax=Rangifer tarandus platyrhynchus TaxID=3082113 RepID=A0ABN9A3P8_RANTA|nr:unnamed protein product [Rangifer tarandus platyrhynchus]CAI9712073.1 unnamed protein product [Rangifer tarandus platyrhynchus]
MSPRAVLPARPPGLSSVHSGVVTSLERVAEVPSSSLWTRRPEALPESWPSAAVLLNVTFTMETQARSTRVPGSRQELGEARKDPRPISGGPAMPTPHRLTSGLCILVVSGIMAFGYCLMPASIGTQPPV